MFRHSVDVARGVRRELQQASSPRLTPKEKSALRGKRSLFLKRDASAARADCDRNQLGRGATLRGRKPGQGHTQGAHTNTRRQGPSNRAASVQRQAFPSDAPSVFS